MLNVSNEYKELTKSNIRPKCEPIIIVSGLDNSTGKEIEIIWNAQDIKDLKFSRSVDPTSKELPTVEMSWTEIYEGKLNEESYPEKYSKLPLNLKAELILIQDLDFSAKWGQVLGISVLGSNKYETWQDLANANITWGTLKSDVPQEKIHLGTTFIFERPTINNQLITWKARDVMRCLNNTRIHGYGVFPDSGAYGQLLLGVAQEELAYARQPYIDSPSIAKALAQSSVNLGKLINDYENFNFAFHELVLVNGTAKDNLKNLASIPNWCWDYMPDGSLTVRDNSLNEYDYRGMDITANVLYNYPTVTRLSNVVSYQFDYYQASVNIDKNYSVKEREVIEIRDEVTGQVDIYYLWLYEGLGRAWQYFNETAEGLFTDYSYATTRNDLEELIVSPIVTSKQTNTFALNDKGDSFIEKNPVNPYSMETDVMKKRRDFLMGYLNDQNFNAEFECLPNLALEPLDGFFVDTNLYNSNGEQIKMPGIIVSIELKYNGALKEKIKMHGVPELFVG